MTRTVVMFDRVGEQVLLTLDDAQIEVPGLGELIPVALPQVGDGTLIERGTLLAEWLQHHDPVRFGLQATLAAPLGSAPVPLYFRVRATSADALPWEQLYAQPHGFCALDGRWPIGRIAARRRDLIDRSFVSPLRIVAVLSAARQSGVPQLQALLAALRTPSAAAIGVALHVISGEQAVLDAAVGPGVTAELIAPDAPGLGRQITAARPHILHALCHGGVTALVRTLAFAHLADFDAEVDDGSVRLTAASLVTALTPGNPWLVVLSACDSAEAEPGQGPALAHDIVSQGMPAVIGMRRLVDLSSTNRFCAALYPELFEVLRAAFDETDADGEQPQVHVVDWAAALTGPRRVMGGPDPSAVDAWTDPVLYAQTQPLRIFLPSPQLSPAQYARLRAKIDVFEKWLANLDPATTDPALIDELRARKADLESKLTPAVVP
jgi:hypothetical protein